MTEVLFWVDVSHWQGKMNWKKAKNAGVEGAFIKATEGLNYVDTQFKDNVDGCQAVGLPHAIYHFWHNNVDTGAQYSNIVKAYEYAKCPIVLDVETFAANLLPHQNAKLLVELVNMIYKNLNMLPTIYTRANIWDARVAPFAKWKELPLWVANYEVNKPLLPRDWNEWMVWQYSAKGDGAKYGASSQFIDCNHVSTAFIKFYTIAQPPQPPAPQPQEYDITITLDGVTYSGKVGKQ